ncbi:PhnD/SsuA/transferrin family substrate-binding protein [Mesorhizobium sp. M0621]|uniref:phosphate/phosphite/phosphonate ABC transporter substrate-binding protein n=1 Tax=Mesorhizobium sp. M0621 TaxID=2956974 RepID=UPI00333A3075
MSELVAALPMYDWPEVRGEVDAQWARLREAFRQKGIDAPQSIVRRNGELPPVPGGIHNNVQGELIAPDPATLPPDELDFPSLWLHPALLFAQTCWGPMEFGLSKHVQLIGQPSYDAYEGGKGELYSSAIIMPADGGISVPSPTDGRAVIPINLIQGKRFTFNSLDSMSGIIALSRDLDDLDPLSQSDLFSENLHSGGHRASIVAVAEGKADVAAIDCESWALAQRFEPAVQAVKVVGWTRRRKGLPFITAKTTPAAIVAVLREAIAAAG